MKYTAKQFTEDRAKLSTMTGAGKYWFRVKIRKLACEHLVKSNILTVREVFELCD